MAVAHIHSNWGTIFTHTTFRYDFLVIHNKHRGIKPKEAGIFIPQMATNFDRTPFFTRWNWAPATRTRWRCWRAWPTWFWCRGRRKLRFCWCKQWRPVRQTWDTNILWPWCQCSAAPLQFFSLFLNTFIFFVVCFFLGVSIYFRYSYDVFWTCRWFSC